jgi:arsenite methyltransferase
MLTDTGFVDIEIGPAVDTFGGAHGEANARTFEVFGYAFLARKPHTLRRAAGSPAARRSV